MAHSILILLKSIIKVLKKGILYILNMTSKQREFYGYSSLHLNLNWLHFSDNILGLLIRLIQKPQPQVLIMRQKEKMEGHIAFCL